MRLLLVTFVIALGASHSHAEPSPDAQKIQHTLRAALKRLSRCHEQPKQPIATRGYRFSIAIRKDGVVSKTTIRTGDARRDACFARTIRSLRFPALTADVVVEYPLVVDPT